ncbi:MAG: OmpL47-type beta-barrel domain-containing protein, partial [Promethearchaeota archaeon]
NRTILGNTTILMPNDGLHSIQLFGNNSIGTMHQSDTRYFTVDFSPHFLIVTPENKTYTEPMSGYYPASYGFENDIVGENPQNWVTDETYGEIQVISELDNHKNVVEINDNGALGWPGITQYSNFPRTYGTIEFWVRFNSTSEWMQFASRDTADNLVPLRVSIEGGKWMYRNNAGTLLVVPNVVDPVINKWTHIRIDFRCHNAPSYLGISNDRFIITVDGISSGELEHWYGGKLDYNWFGITGAPDETMKIWVDAVGFAWDPNYNIGDNLNEGLLLSYTNDTALEWIGYSLDNQVNRTILGNTTILMPNDGLHSIQLFGNKSIGTMYHSDARHFSIDTTGPIITVIEPELDDFFGSTAPDFSISIDELNLNTSWYSIDNGITNITFSGLSGTINQTEWDDLIDGSLSIKFYANDSWGLKGYADVDVWKDTSAPNSSILFTPHSGIDVVNESTGFSLIADDGTGSGVSFIRYKINDSSWITYNTPFTLASYPYGDILISYQAVDQVDNYETTQTLLVERTDTISPTSSIIFTPYSGINEVIKSTLFTITAADDNFGSGISLIRYKIDDSIWFDYLGPFDLTSYENGDHIVICQAIDNAGNIEIEHGIAVVLISEPTSDTSISGYNSLIIFCIIGIISVMIFKKRQKFKY